MIDSFVLYSDMYNEIKLLSTEQKGNLLDLIFRYVNDEELPDNNDIALKIVFSTIRRSIDINAEKYKKVVEERRAAGKKGGAPLGNQNARKTSKTNNWLNNQANQPDNDTFPVPDNIPDIDPVLDNNSFSFLDGCDCGRGRGRGSVDVPFIPPTIEEIEKYADSINETIDAELFVDYYESIGWVIGKGRQMKDWKAAVRNWIKRDDNF